MENKLETMLPGLNDSAYDRIRGVQATVMDQLQRDVEIARDEASPIRANQFLGEGFMDAYRELYKTAAQEYIDAGPDRDICLKGIEHVDQYVKALPFPNPSWNGVTWGAYCQLDHADEIRAHWELRAKRKWPPERVTLKSIHERLKLARDAAEQSLEAAGIEISELAGRKKPFPPKTVERWEKALVREIQKSNSIAIEKYISLHLPN